ncbi:hypothetical protein [Brachyspira hyodysenteriae]|uniref:hypothetical protein n=1 Tax=Brachyspira hyodysenteriae TaxID=159 RepID=UPI00063DC49C|nr:hypothetical protein [Brachyspira hyodysenteriae]KLI52951.1 hypothetical protein SZ42_03550 [Brachyspira hyodysenteriae]
MCKKIILLLISLFLLSCTSPFGQMGIKFKDREGTYQDDLKNITVSVTKASKQNLIIDIRDVNGIALNDVYDINASTTTGNFTLKSENNKDYAYSISFYGNSSLVISVRTGRNYPINNQELKKISYNN